MLRVTPSLTAICGLFELALVPQAMWASISRFGENTNKNVQELGHSAMLHSPSGTGCQIRFTEQKTLLSSGRCWNHICFQLCDPLILPPLPNVFLPLVSYSLFSISFARRNEDGVFLRGVRLRSTSGHWYWHRLATFVLDIKEAVHTTKAARTLLTVVCCKSC